MGANSQIEWTTHTFNPWRGCEHAVLSDGSEHPGCAHCYAEAMSKRNPSALGTWGANGRRVVASEEMWAKPLKWDKAAKEAGKRHRVFCASLADVFEDWKGPMSDAQERELWVHDCEPHPEPNRYVPMPREGESALLPHERENLTNGMYRRLTLADLRRRLFALIDNTPNLDWLLLTKRPENVRRMWCSHVNTDGLPPSRLHRKNVGIGTSISDQPTADVLVPRLLKCRDLSPVLFLSVEPMLGPITLDRLQAPGAKEGLCYNALNATDDNRYYEAPASIDWVIVGGESGRGARPMHPDWVRSIRDQCQTASVPFFFKQWGDWSAETVPGTSPRLDELAPNQQVGWGDGKSNHILYTRVGKKAAGRWLDGREWSEFPGVEVSA